MATNRKKHKKKKVVIKKRFFFICILIVVLILFLMIMGLKSVIGLIFGDDKAKDISGDTGTKVETDANTGQSSSNEAVDSQVNTQNQQTSQNQSNTQTNAIGNENHSGTNPIAFTGIAAADSTEYEINKAVLCSWYISPLGQKRSTIDESFGTISRSEEWGRRIFYHRSFIDTMYVTYEGELKGDNTPVKDAICDSVSIALKNILEFDKFTPNVSFWGQMYEDEGTFSEGPYYLVSIRSDITMKVFCDQHGRVSGESHIIVSKC